MTWVGKVCCARPGSRSVFGKHLAHEEPVRCWWRGFVVSCSSWVIGIKAVADASASVLDVTGVGQVRQCHSRFTLGSLGQAAWFRRSGWVLPVEIVLLCESGICYSAPVSIESQSSLICPSPHLRNETIGLLVLRFPFSSNIILFYVSSPFDFSSSLIILT